MHEIYLNFIYEDVAYLGYGSLKALISKRI